LNINISKKIFNEVYLPYVEDYNTRYFILYGGAGSGKSVFAVQRMIWQLLNEKRRALVVRKIGGTNIKHSIFEEFKTCLGKWNLYNRCNVNLSDMVITLPNGSVILFKGLDDNEKIKSISGIDNILIEEATELTLEDFEQLNLRLRSAKPNQQIVLCYNPISKVSWVYTRFHENIDEDATILKTTYLDNKFLPDKYVQSLLKLKSTNYTYYKIYCLGEFGTLGKQIFTNYRVEDLSNHKQINKLRVGQDYGYSEDITACILIDIDVINKKLYVIDEFTGKGLLTDEIASGLINRGWHKYTNVGDSAELRLIQELRNKGINIKPAKKGKDSVLHGITYLQQFEIIIDKRCLTTIEEFANYTWEKDKKTGEYINKPIDKYNHTIDSVRYGVEDFAFIGKDVGNIKKALGL
jgi:phage terminase large subunit